MHLDRHYLQRRLWLECSALTTMGELIQSAQTMYPTEGLTSLVLMTTIYSGTSFSPGGFHLAIDGALNRAGPWTSCQLYQVDPGTQRALLSAGASPNEPSRFLWPWLRWRWMSTEGPITDANLCFETRVQPRR